MLVGLVVDEDDSLRLEVCVIVTVLEVTEAVEDIDEVALVESMALDEEDWDEMLALFVEGVLEATLLGEVDDGVVDLVTLLLEVSLAE